MTRDADIPPLRKRILAYDALRLFSILTVVAIHCFMPLRGDLPRTAPGAVIDDVLHYAVPVFVFISGALLWARPWQPAPGAFRRFAASRLKAVGLPYLVWALVFLGLSAALAADPVKQLTQAPLLLLSGHVWYHLYFVPMLLTFYALTPVAARVMRKQPELGLLAAYAIRLLLWLVLSPWLQSHAHPLVWSWASHVVAHLPHMALGAWFVLRFELFPRWLRRLWPVLLVYGFGGLSALSLGQLTAWPFLLRRFAEADFMAGVVLGLAFAAFELEPLYDRFHRAVVAGAALSFGVYFVHPLFLEAIFRGAKSAGLERLWFEWWAVPSAWVVVSALSLLTAWVLSISPKTAWLIGVKAAHSKDVKRLPAQHGDRTGGNDGEATG